MPFAAREKPPRELPYPIRKLVPYPPKSSTENGYTEDCRLHRRTGDQALNEPRENCQQECQAGKGYSQLEKKGEQAPPGGKLRLRGRKVSATAL
jgi:hypothetical protein